MTADETETEVPDAENILCPREGSFPSVSELRLGLGETNVSALHACVIIVMLINLVMFLILVYKFFKNVPQVQVQTRSNNPCTGSPKNIYILWKIQRHGKSFSGYPVCIFYIKLFFPDSQPLLGDLNVHGDVICVDTDGVPAQVNRVSDGIIPCVRGRGDQQVRGAQHDVVGR